MHTSGISRTAPLATTNGVVLILGVCDNHNMADIVAWLGLVMDVVRIKVTGGDVRSVLY